MVPMLREEMGSDKSRQPRGFNVFVVFSILKKDKKKHVLDPM